jgi:hypothetical protein
VAGPNPGPACAAVEAEDDNEADQHRASTESGGSHTRTWESVLLEHADLPVWEAAPAEKCKLTLGQVRSRHDVTTDL